MLTVPLGVVEVCQAGTSFTHPQSNVAVPPRLQLTTSSPSSSHLPGELGDRDQRRAGALADRDRVTDVVGVAVGEQQRCRRDLVGGRRGFGITGQERIDQDGRVAV